ncbi:unnamed protein product [Vitrella brassicaformis CCMP3155]|uniref:Protein kinase domain-containing protein n=1 Tax=Vitrella brassicaformis (strain CCMP3155) TaxID=1169540 RepID=A0A0G4EEU8_VITBC|nr:unnamed protein product [Vitrella brassicaformis CCMP3155]|eukprot:CEL93898.1 unnamed protein product [Vitrella brassicaformis CCMP3155]
MQKTRVVEVKWETKVAERDVERALHDLYGLRVEGKLGYGGQAELWRLSRGKVVKVLDKNYSVGGPNHKPTFQLHHEKGLAKCPQLVRLHGAFTGSRCGSCAAVWGEGDAKTITRDLPLRRLAHLDVKPDNLIRRGDGSSVLIDLDFMARYETGDGRRKDMRDTVSTLLMLLGVDSETVNTVLAADTPTEEDIVVYVLYLTEVFPTALRSLPKRDDPMGWQGILSPLQGDLVYGGRALHSRHKFYAHLKLSVLRLGSSGAYKNMAALCRKLTDLCKDENITVSVLSWDDGAESLPVAKGTAPHSPPQPKWLRRPTEEAIRQALYPFAPSTEVVDFIAKLLKGMSAQEVS